MKGQADVYSVTIGRVPYLLCHAVRHALIVSALLHCELPFLEPLLPGVD